MEASRVSLYRYSLQFHNLIFLLYTTSKKAARKPDSPDVLLYTMNLRTTSGPSPFLAIEIKITESPKSKIHHNRNKSTNIFSEMQAPPQE